MQLEIRLKKILQQSGLDTHGVVQRMARDLNVHRHTIGKLYRNEAANPSLDVLAQVCQWLEHQGVPHESLPQALLGVRHSDLWTAVAARGAVTLYVGEYRQMPAGPRPLRWIAQHDAMAMAKIVQSLFSAAEMAKRLVPVSIEYVPFRFVPGRRPGPHDDHLDKDAQRAGEIFRSMRAVGRPGSSILLGSQRANHLVELLVADLFGCEPFRPPTNPGRAVPFYLVFRKDDRGVPSCFGGHDAPPGSKLPAGPGVYYRAKSGWLACPWKQGVQDAGVIVIARDKGTGTLEMAVFGFSGAGTEALVQELLRGPDRFWPPRARIDEKEVGVHVCRFTLTEVTSPNREPEVRTGNVEVISLDPEILQRRAG